MKQIIGGSLRDSGDYAKENFVAEHDASYFAELYRKSGIKGGHIILLNAVSSPYYEATKEQAFNALRSYPKGLQIGGGITPGNACQFLEAGASHVIVTSYVFRDGMIRFDRLEEIKKAVGKKHLVLDVSCKKVGNDYLVVTDRWQNVTDEKVNIEFLTRLSDYCDEFLVHAVDVEGKNNGIEQELVKQLGEWNGCPLTYAGGVHTYADLETLKQLGHGRINVTIGSALDLFGGNLSWEKVQEICRHSKGE